MDDFPSPGCRASRAFIGVGSNQGDRMESIRRAAVALAESDGIELVATSPVYETKPVGPVGPALFLNCVLELDVHLSPRQLLHQMQEIEEQLGRRPPRNGPRPIDLDLLFYDDLVFSSGDLIVPHPRMTQREFVLRPLADLVPEMCHPECGKSVSELLELSAGHGEVIEVWPESLHTESLSPRR